MHLNFSLIGPACNRCRQPVCVCEIYEIMGIHVNCIDDCVYLMLLSQTALWVGLALDQCWGNSTDIGSTLDHPTLLYCKGSYWSPNQEYSENAWMSAKWQWNARDCVTGLQSSNTSRVCFTVISHTPMRYRVYHTHIRYKRNWEDFCLVNLIYLVFFKFAICFIALMNLGETCHLNNWFSNLVTPYGDMELGQHWLM